MRCFPEGLRVEPTKEYCRLMNEQWTGEVQSPTNENGIVTVFTSELDVEHINEKWLVSVGIN